MECPHLESSAIITTTGVDVSPEWVCSVCKSSQSPWICLYCGAVHCGRYINGHAKAHFEERPQHTVCMDCTSYATYCYTCDEFVINDTEIKHLQQLQRCLQGLNEPVSDPKEKLRRRRDSGESKSEKTSCKKHKTENSVRRGKNGKLKVVGLRNLGNTCFMNAVLQSLSNIQQFCCYFKELPALDAKIHKNGRNVIQATNKQQKETSDDILMAEELRKTLIALGQGNKSAISPQSLFTVVWKVVPRFRGYQQQDAHEFLRYMLDRLHTELLNILPYPNATSPFLGAKGKSTIVTGIFGGVLQNEVNCLVCGTESIKHDPFLDLSLDIPLQFHIKNSKTKEEAAAAEPPPVCELADCLQSFTELEELAESELYYCNNCKTKQRSTKKFWIRRLPNVLCLHLKRFRWNNYFRTKLDNYVQFPVKGLDMTKFILSNMHETRGSGGGSTEYDLAAVIVHHGSGAGSGHYTVYATREGEWFHFDDLRVSISDEEAVAKCKAYILFYIRRELKLPNVGS